MSNPQTLPSPRTAHFRAAGLWRDRSMNWYREQAIARTPDKLAVVAYRVDRDLPTRLSYRGFDFAAMAFGMRASLPHRQHLIIVGGIGADSFERRLMASVSATETSVVCQRPVDCRGRWRQQHPSVRANCAGALALHL